MKNTGLAGEYIFWMKDELFYKYGEEIFFPVFIVNLLFWYLFYFFEKIYLTISIYVIYSLFALVRLLNIPGFTKGKSIIKPFFVFLILFVFSLCVLLACLSTEIRGPYSEFF